jgi:hypothetical protein
MTYAPLTAALLLGLLLAASPAASQKLGLRESCRQDVATIYLAAHTNMEQTANELTLLKQQLNMLLPKHEAAERAFNKARDEADAAHFDQNKTDRREAAAEAFRAISQSVQEQRNLIKRGETRVVDTKATETTLRERLSKVFFIRDVPLKGGAGKSVALEYKSSCPKFRATCPLPRDEAWELERLLDNTPETCLRYSKIRAPR